MGNDGGSIPTRRELVKSAARTPTTTELKATQSESQLHAWTHDPLSHLPLALPIVSDCHGRLYNKDSIIEFLLPSSSSTSDNNDDGGEEGRERREKEKVINGAVKSLRDVVEVKFEVEKTARDGQAEQWRCPVTAAVLGPASKAVYLVPCGHAFSGAAIKEVANKDKGGKCLVCETEYAEEDVVGILPTRDEEIARLSLRAKALKERGLTHSLKKDKTSATGGKKRKIKAVDESGVSNGAEVPVTLVEAKSGKVNGSKMEAVASTRRSGTTAMAHNIRNSSTASLTARVMAEQEASKKRRMDNDNLRTLFSNRDPAKPHGRSSDFMTRGFDIPAGAKR